MKLTNIIISVLILYIFSACAPEVNSEPDQIKIKGEIQTVIDAYVNHANTKGIQGVEYYFSKDKRFYWVEDGVLQYPNRAALLQGINQFAPSVDSVKLVTSVSNIEVLNNNQAMWYVEYKEDLTLNSGFKFTLDGAMTILMHREDKTWKFLTGHSSIKKPRGGN